jgi:predicted PurR-regulated permease PerM
MKQNNKAFKIIYIVFTAIVVCFGFYFYKSILSYLIIALFFVTIFNPLINLIERLGIKRTWAVLIFYVIFFLNIILLANVFIPKLLEQIKNFTAILMNFLNQEKLESTDQLTYLAKIQGIYEQLKALLPFVDFDNIKSNFLDKTISLVGKIPDLIISYSGNVFKIITYLISVPIISFFILKDQIFLKKKIYSLIPNKYFEISIIIIDKVKDTIGTYLRALLIEMCILSTLASIILSVLGIRFAILIGILSGVLNVIPYLGPFTGFVLGGLTVMLTGGSTTLLVLTLICMFGLNTMDNTIIYPLVMGNKTKIHPAVIILSVLAGGITFGLLGMLLAVPSVFLATGVLTLLYKSLKQFEII